MIANKNKTVYILGAGASAAVRLPIQNKLIDEIFKITEPPKNEKDDFLVSTDLLTFSFNNFIISRRYLADFLITNYVKADDRYSYLSIKDSYSNDISFFEDYSSEALWVDIYCMLSNFNVCLEDIFTTLDKAELNNEYYSRYTLEALKKIKNSLNNCIIYMLSYHIKLAKNNKLYVNIANYFVNKRLEGLNPKQDTFSIITLNWDTLLDTAIYSACEERNTILDPKIKPDYCCYNYDLNSNVPSTQIKARGMYNIKIMKLHGSINWLYCPNCGRLFTDFNEHISLASITENMEQPRSCDFCKNDRATFLKPILITPTFLKDINNLHLKSIWHNAYLDLCEATEVIFIGYSLPDADFELKYILKKALSPHAKIKVILHKYDDPQYYEHLLFKCPNADVIKNKLNLPENRYNTFFANHDIDFDYNGIESFFQI